jgi:hypothetical protein
LIWINGSVRSPVKYVWLGERLCQNPEQFKAWSQNLGHEGVLTTLFAYGTVPEGRQREIMTSFGAASER